MEKIPEIDVIVVGAGPSGVACALTAARGGSKVLVIEKASDFGVKNMFGGAIYFESLKELIPDEWQDLPYERVLTSFNYAILNNSNSTVVSYKNSRNKKAAVIGRFGFDTFLCEIARKNGVYFANNTTVVDLIKKNGQIIGVKTEFEEIYAPIVVLAEGFNSILSERAGLKRKTEPKSAILAVKEVYRLPGDLIEKRFNLKEKEGALYEFFGGISKENEDVPLAMGFLYTFKNYVSLGLGISMESLKNGKIKPYEYLDRLKENELTASLIEGGEFIEYSAHSIPEGGYRELPKFYDNGVLLVGDCANLVDSVHFEGTNLAIKSGIIAGHTCCLAIKRRDFTKKTLKNYKKELYKSFVIQDLKTYKNVISTLYKRRSSVFKFYPEKINEFMKIWTSADNTGKKKEYRRFIGGFFRRGLFYDVISFVKCAIEAVI